jgi:hypothetical protein
MSKLYIITIIGCLSVGCLGGVSVLDNSLLNEVKSLKSENKSLKDKSDNLSNKYTDNQDKINQFCKQFRS